MHQGFYKKYQELLSKFYPLAGSTDFSQLVSPFVVNIPFFVVDEIKKTIKILYKTAHLKAYKEYLEEKKAFGAEYLKAPAPSSSVLMSYDFHWSKDLGLKLIEVNTHSAAFLMSELASQAHNVLQNPGLDNLKQSFEDEWADFLKLTKKTPKQPAHFVIMDQEITKQKMYVEFLMFKDFFKKFLNWPCELIESSEIKLDSENSHLVDDKGQKIDMIYSRSTDFYLSSLPAVKKAFMKGAVCLSPHPVEYFLLADKSRLCDWSSLDFFKKLNLRSEDINWLKKILPKAFLVKSFSRGQLWKERKKFFFKPLRSYRGKSVYKGKSITQEIFNRIIEEQDFLCQELAPPGFFIDSKNIKWKYDIRAFVYKDQVQYLSARVYQGQMTNSLDKYAGWACLKSV